MVDEETFLTALKDAPPNDPLWLIYADWLEERGDPRSQDVRLCCKEGRPPAPDPPSPQWTYVCGRCQMRGLRPAGRGTLAFGCCFGALPGYLSELRNPGITNAVPMACAFAAGLAGLAALIGLCVGFGIGKGTSWPARLAAILAGPILGATAGALMVH